jgi:hypothetical protein
MPSPFPGMDPYLEDPAFWPDFHFTFLFCWREAIADLLPDDYEARVDERVNLVQMSPEVIRLIYPDLAVTKRPKAANRQVQGAAAGTLLLEPVTIQHEFLEEVREARIEILHRPDRILVGVVELLSPANKTADGFSEYRAKRRSVLSQKVHLVELDLLVGGRRLPLRKPLPGGDYHAFVSRANRRPDCAVYSWTVRQQLPAIPIPLKEPDPDLLIDLENVFRTAYERGRYRKSLRYDLPPQAPLKEKDKRWAIKQVTGK